MKPELSFYQIILPDMRLSCDGRYLNGSREARKCKRFALCPGYSEKNRAEFRLCQVIRKQSLPKFLFYSDLTDVYLVSSEWLKLICGDDWDPYLLFQISDVFIRGSSAVLTHKAVTPVFSVDMDLPPGAPDAKRVMCKHCGKQLFAPSTGSTLDYDHFWKEPPTRIPPVFSIARGMGLGVSSEGLNRFDWKCLKGIDILPIRINPSKVCDFALVDPDDYLRKISPRPPLP